MAKKHSKSRFSSIVIIALLIFGVYIYITSGNNSSNSSYSNSSNSSVSQTPVTSVIDGNKEDITNYDAQVLFCPEDKCMDKLLSLIDKSKSVHCSVYEIDYPPVYELLNSKAKLGNDIRIIMDDDQFNGVRKEYDKNLQMNSLIDYLYDKNLIRLDNSSGYMHNKFCIFDNNVVWVGSFNFIKNDLLYNNNNVIIFYDSNLYPLFNSEFDEQWNGIFNKGEQSYSQSSYPKAYFCPEDNCVAKYLEELSKAKERVWCMFFSFTQDDLGAKLVELKKNNVNIKVIFESSQNSQYSEYNLLKQNGIESIIDKNPKLMHNKFCLIDSNIVITGSMNPSKRSQELNDESIVIVNDYNINKKYSDYFSKYYVLWN